MSSVQPQEGPAAALGAVPQPVVRRNDWAPLEPGVAAVTPRLPVSVVIPSYGSQDRLDLTLAALAAQTYPSHLLEVLVVDDGSQPPLRLPELRPESCAILRAPDDGWGRAHACHTGALAASGTVIHWLDADMVTFPDHVEQQLRWHHLADYLVTIGYKRLVETWSLDPLAVHRAGEHAQTATLFTEQGTLPHAWVEELIDRTDGLRAAGPEAFRATVGATAALHRDLYLASGGMDVTLRLGEDSELAYRLAQRGAVFVPVPAARSWHLGVPTASAHPELVRRHNWPYLADRMPLPRFRRWQAGRIWHVPYVEVVVDATGQPAERVSAAVESVLAGSLTDCAITLIGPWQSVGDGRYRPLQGDAGTDLRLLREQLGGDPRVRMTELAAPTAFPATFRLELAPGWVLDHHALERVVDEADRRRSGLLEIGSGDQVCRMWRTAAVERGRRVLPGSADVESVDRVWGRGQVSPAAVGLLEHAALDRSDLRWLIGASGVSRVSPRRAAALRRARSAKRLTRQVLGRRRRTGS